MSKPKPDDKALLERLRKEAPEVLRAKVNFDAVITRVLAHVPKDKPKRTKPVREKSR